MPKHVRTLKAKRRNRIQPVLVKLAKKGVATAAQIGISPVEALGLEKEKLVVRAGTVQTGKPGRPAVQWRLSYKGRQRTQTA